MNGQSKRRECVSHSTPEAEIVAADWALRREGILMLDMWDILAGRGQKVVFHDDYESMLKVCKTGKNPTVRHLLRTHGVSVAWLKEQFDTGSYDLRYVPSALQAADIYTKGFDSAEKWTANCRLISLYSPAEADIGKLVQFWKDVEASSKPFVDDSHPPSPRRGSGTGDVCVSHA